MGFVLKLGLVLKGFGFEVVLVLKLFFEGVWVLKGFGFEGGLVLKGVLVLKGFWF